MDTDKVAELFREFMSGRTPFPQGTSIYSNKDGSREERITDFNKASSMCQSIPISRQVMTTFNYIKKGQSKQPRLDQLRLIKISQLEVGKTHRGRVVFCTIVSKVLIMNSASVLVEDDSEMVPLAVYGLDQSGVKELKEERKIAVIEPFFKIRADGTKGIRVDDPSDIAFFDTNSTVELNAQLKRVSVEVRLEEIVRSDQSITTNKLYETLIAEGYSANKKRVQALKVSILEGVKEKTENECKVNPIGHTLVPILSERRPENHQVFTSAVVVQKREAGNIAFKSGNFEEAEACYTASLQHAENDRDEEQRPKTSKEEEIQEEGVALWQLYGNRAASRLKLGMLDEALQDSLASNICAPENAIKPILRCAEILAALGLAKEAFHLLDAAGLNFPGEIQTLETKKQLLSPKQMLYVGPNKEFSSIAKALSVAPPGSEILVDCGIYSEPLFFSKPVTVRSTAIDDDYAAIISLEGGDKQRWAEICVEGTHAISCIRSLIHIIGFSIKCIGSKIDSLHSVLATDGAKVVLRNCVVTGNSGPVVAADQMKTKLVLHACAVHGGSQGGILVADQAHLSSNQVHCCQNAASGLELRRGGSAQIEGSHFYGNGRQGIVSWISAGRLFVKNSEIHSNTIESGILVAEAEAFIQSCVISGNGAAGIVAQQKGRVQVRNCKVYGNCEGILIQDSGSGIVENCDIFSNRANGIFIGFDHHESASILGNNIHNNCSKGILVGNKTKQVVLQGNIERDNKGLPPQFPASFLGSERTAPTLSDEHLKFLKKNQTNIAKTIESQQHRGSFFNHLAKQHSEEASTSLVQGFEKYLNACMFCKKLPPKGKEKNKRCGRCQAVSYCSRECQKAHWPEHKVNCTPKTVKYPSFLDNQTPV